MKQVSNSFVHDKAHSLRALAPLGIFGLLFANLTICNTTFAESVSISVSSAAETFALAPGSSSVFGKSNNITASITTDYPYGYEFTVAGPNDEQKLKSTNSHLLSISSVATENDFKTGASTTYDNKWGFLPSKLNSTSNTEYQPSPKKTTPTQIDVTTSANPDTANDYTFAIAARVDNTVPKETYTGDFTLAAVANYAYFGIGFADVSSGMPAVIHGLTNNGNITFTAPAAPTKTGYTFRGWCSIETGNNGSCSGTTYEAGTEYTISLSNNFVNTYTTLYARWTLDPACVAKYEMQKVTEWAHCLSDGGLPVTAIDSRDSKTYLVAKIPNGKIWMLDNLAFIPTDGFVLTPSNTNVTTNKEVEDWDLDWSARYYSYTKPTINKDLLTAAEDSHPDWKIGALYNFAAATAGTFATEVGDEPEITGESQDICPAGWRLPVFSDSNDEIQQAYAAITGDNCETSCTLRYREFREALRIPLVQDIASAAGISDNIGSLTYSSKSNGDGYNVRGLYLGRSTLVFGGSSNRRAGNVVRCVAK